jgi:cell division cycle 14
MYWNFFLDYGPLNLGQLYRYCTILNAKLADARLKDKAIYYYSSNEIGKKANAIYLMCAWSMLCLNKTPDEAFRPFRSVPLLPWHDATNTICTFNLTLLDTLRGLHKARECNFFNFDKFDINEYEYYEQVENGDLNWCMDGKFIAFAGPHAARESHPGGYHTLCPDDYVPYFKRRNVGLVVRLNKKYYDAKKFTNHGIKHVELYFLDGSNPPDSILTKFISLSEETPGAVAVHCKAGLGRTGSCIGAYMMKHYRFTAEEVIGWLRIVRPGSIIGPQQQFMKEIEQRMWRDGELFRARLSSGLSSSSSSSNHDNNGSELDTQQKASSSSSSITTKISNLTMTEEGKEMQGDSLRARRLGGGHGIATSQLSQSSASSLSSSSTRSNNKSVYNSFMSSWK